MSALKRTNIDEMRFTEELIIRLSWSMKRKVLSV